MTYFFFSLFNTNPDSGIVTILAYPSLFSTPPRWSSSNSLLSLSLDTLDSHLSIPERCGNIPAAFALFFSSPYYPWPDLVISPMMKAFPLVPFL